MLRSTSCRASVGAVDVSVIAHFVALHDAVTTALNLATGRAVIAVNRVSVVIVFADLEIPIATDFQVTCGKSNRRC